MSIFDITPAGAYMNAITAANEKDRQNARRVQDTLVTATPKTKPSAVALWTRSLARAFGTIMALRPAASPRSKPL